MKHYVRQSMAILVAMIGCVAPDLVIAGPEEDLNAAILAYDRGDLIGAMALFQSAADSGLAEAQVRLAYIHDYSENNEEAVSLYRAAADQGSSDGYLGLGEMYAKGEGVKTDFKVALDFFNMAAELDNTRAMLQLARYYKDGELGLVVDLERAGEWLIRAAELGDPAATKELVAAYQEGGFGLQVNPERVAFWQNRLETRREENE